ncbi:MAG: hypothetical protein AMS27_10825 [Bacteroides sp. SM23_62_1]|nr:MAG: hypothetical protein AMS27_10825 [Bacteroides sp. SM23_62_1]
MQILAPDQADEIIYSTIYLQKTARCLLDDELPPAVQTRKTTNSYFLSYYHYFNLTVIAFL